MKYEISFRNPLDNSESAALAIDPKMTKIIIESLYPPVGYEISFQNPLYNSEAATVAD